jgi:hypothetical protein
LPAVRYPKATWKGDGTSGGSYTTGPFKLVLHTTETAGIPIYDNAPHLTYYARERRFVQHLQFDTAARALRNEAGGVQTNRDSAIQLEIVAYSAESIVDQYPNTGRVKVSELTAEQLADIREFILWACEEFGIEYKWPEKQAFSYSQANAAGFRMSNAEWDSYNGVCGHQHVPENTHWDPGAINWLALMEDDMPAPTQWTEADKAVVAALVNANSVGAFIGKDENRRSIATAIANTEKVVTLVKAQLAALPESDVELSSEDIGVIADAIRQDLGEEIAKAIGRKLVA